MTRRGPPEPGRHPVRPRRRHLRLDAPGPLSTARSPCPAGRTGFAGGPTKPNTYGVAMKALLLENIHPRPSRSSRTAASRSSCARARCSEAELIESLDGVGLLGIRSNTDRDRAGPGGRARPGGDRLLLHRHQPGRPGRGRGARHRGVQRAVLQHPQRGRARDRRDHRAGPAAAGEDPADARRRLGQVRARAATRCAAGRSGIVGYGNIGTQLSNLAESLGMRVVFYDTADRPAHGNARRMGSLDDLLEVADVVSLHVDGRPGNAGLFGAEEFAAMKPRSMFINASRGMVVDDVSLRDHLLVRPHRRARRSTCSRSSRRPRATTFESVLRGLDNVILTPHVGGSTQEAQEEIGWFVAGKLAGFALEGNTSLSVNLPSVVAPPRGADHRLALPAPQRPRRARRGQRAVRRRRRQRHRAAHVAPRASSATSSPTPRTRSARLPSSSCAARSTACGCAPGSRGTVSGRADRGRHGRVMVALLPK